MQYILEKYRTKGAILDTNLMVLLAVGNCDRRRITSFKRTSKYTEDDFDLLVRILRFFQRRITTPNILTEVDNLTRQLPSAEYASVARVMQLIVSELFEIHIPSAEAVQSASFPDFGLTDCITMACAQEALLITDDFRLSNTLSTLGRDVININHIRLLG